MSLTQGLSRKPDETLKLLLYVVNASGAVTHPALLDLLGTGFGETDGREEKQGDGGAPHLGRAAECSSRARRATFVES